jgi:uncharacterized protein (TIGR02145 family)
MRNHILFKMKKFIILIFLSGLSVNAMAQEAAGVQIGGITWASVNVGEEGQFVAKPNERGGYYDWYDAQKVCPEGWRLPTADEIDSLLQQPQKVTVIAGVQGREFGKAPNTIFLPEGGRNHSTPRAFNRSSTGMRASSVELDNSIAKNGYYWSSDKTFMGNGRYLYFDKKHVRRTTFDSMARFSVRCVMAE